MNRICRAVVALTLLCLSLPLNAQPYEWQRCDTCYKNYNYNRAIDSVFVLGALEISDNLMRIAKDSLRMNMTLFYRGPTRIDSASLPTTDISTDTSILRMRRVLWQAQVHGMKVMFAPHAIEVLGKESLLATDFHPGFVTDMVQSLDLQYRSPNSYVDTTLRARHFIEGWQDTVTTGITSLLVSKPRFTVGAIMGANPLHYGWVDSLTSVKSYPDSSKFMRYSMTLKANNGAAIGEEVDDSTLLAYTVLYRRDVRDTVGASGNRCTCANYTPFDTVRVTKLVYNENTLSKDVGDGYRAVHSDYFNVDSFPSKAAGVYYASTDSACRARCEALRVRLGGTMITERGPDSPVC